MKSLNFMWSYTNKMYAVNKIFFISLIISCMTLSAYATTDKQKIISVTEDIKYLSQKIANDYLYLYHDPKKSALKEELNRSIKKLEENFRFIAKNSNNADTKNILDFLSYSKDQMKETISSDISKENVSSMLDFSDTMLEGAGSILEVQKHNRSESKFHLLMISKLYMAINLDFDKTNNMQELKKEIKLFNSNHASNSSWIAFKNIVENNQESFIPNIISLLVKDLEKHENHN